MERIAVLFDEKDTAWLTAEAKKYCRTVEDQVRWAVRSAQAFAVAQRGIVVHSDGNDD